jgi:hypothetical protein
MITQEQISRGGSKLEITRALMEKGFPYIPDSTFLYAGQDLSSIERDVQRMLRNDGRVIVRGSNPADYHGAVGVFPTDLNITSISQVERCIRAAQEYMKKPEVKRYIELNDRQAFVPELHFLIQRQAKLRSRGQLLEHPHCDYVYGGVLDGPSNRLFTQQMDLIKGELETTGAFPEIDIDVFRRYEERIYFEILPALKEVGVLDESFAHNFEIGLEDGLIFQARPFKKFQEPVEHKLDFSQIPHVCWRGNYKRMRGIFGITDEEGIDLINVSLPTQQELFNFQYYGDNFNAGDEDYSLYLPFDSVHQSSSIDFIFSNMRAALLPSPVYDCLTHNIYRFMKKAELVVTGNLFRRREDMLKEERMTYFADGKSITIVPTRYLE